MNNNDSTKRGTKGLKTLILFKIISVLKFICLLNVYWYYQLDAYYIYAYLKQALHMSSKNVNVVNSILRNQFKSDFKCDK